MNYFNSRAVKTIMTKVIPTLSKIKVYGGHCRYNFRCQHNAVHDAIENGESRIAMTMYIDGTYPIIHFINVNANGKFTDNTLGHWSSAYEYYLVRYIDKEDFFKVNTIFVNYRNELRNHMPFFVKHLSTWVF